MVVGFPSVGQAGVIFFGWRRLEDIPEELFEWVPRMEQLEMWEMPCGPDGVADASETWYLDREVSVSAMSESEAQDVQLLHDLAKVYPLVREGG